MVDNGRQNLSEHIPLMLQVKGSYHIPCVGFTSYDAEGSLGIYDMFTNHGVTSADVPAFV